jgi:hypothetical protein
MKPVLSDQGSALHKFCVDNNILQFLCHRHLIELFGASTALGVLVGVVLREPTQDSYREHRPEYRAIAQALLDRHVITLEAYRKFLDFLSEKLPHGIWNRAGFGMSTCSNHTERFHGAVNQHLKPCETLPERLAVIRDPMIQKLVDFGDHRYDKVMGILAPLKGIPAPQRPVCFEPECIHYVQLMQCRFGVMPFPCKHTLNGWHAQMVMAFPARPIDLPAESIHRSEIIQNHK